MDNKSSILIDINVLLDVLQKREPFYETSANLLAAVETRRVQGFVAAHSMMTLFYLIQKSRSSSEAHAILTNLLQFIQVAPVDQNTIEQALNLDFRDFEDAVQMVSALQSRVDCLITRNLKDYPVTLLPVMQPVDFLSTL
jgi:predicted nucleic acid-binding protein